MNAAEKSNMNVATGKKLDKAIIDELVRRIVQSAGPDKIVLFGSAAKGEMGPNSDIDVLIVKNGDFHRGKVTEEIYRNLWGFGCAVDVVVVTHEDVEKYKNSFCLIIEPALREGMVVYDRSSLAA